MKHAILLLLWLTAGMTVCAQAPATLITHTWNDTSLSDILRTIAGHSSEYHIHCIFDQLDELRVSSKVVGLTVPDAVQKVCKGQPVKVKMKGHDIFVQYKKRMENKKIVLKGKVLDRLTHSHLVGATVVLMNHDSTIVDQVVARTAYQEWAKIWEKAEFSFNVPKMENRYILAVSFVGYETAYLNYTISNLRKSEIIRYLPDIYLKQESHMLNDVNVVASKVTFYNRGDTIVYKADAFQLAEGSMLDALIKQLPGAELRNGQIFLNGKFVENLLLNGKDFFRGDNELMLENLPSYTVKEIKVYDRLGDKSRFLGQEQPSDKTYVMDVQLRKEYSIGLTANLEAGAATHDRYLARLFAMRFTDHSRMALYANVNNLNDNRKPGENENWEPSNLKPGLMAEKLAGMDYNVEERDERWKVNGNMQFAYSDNDTQTTTNRTNFLSRGNTVDKLLENVRNKSWKLTTDNKFYANFGGFDLEVTPVLSHQKYDFRNGTTLQTFSTISPPEGAQEGSSLYSQWQRGKLRGHETNLEVTARSNVKINNEQHLEFKVSASHVNKDDDRFNRQQVQYAASSLQPALNLDQHLRNHPDRTTKLFGQATFARQLSLDKQGFLEYSYEHTARHHDNALYLLEDSIETPLALEAARVFDAQNSFSYQSFDNHHALRPYLFWHPKMRSGSVTVGLFARANWHSQYINYHRGGIDTILTRHTTYFDLPYNYFKWSNGKKLSGWLTYNYEVTPPSLTHFVDIRDTTDPMNIHLGNPDLKNIGHHTIDIVLQRIDMERQISQNLFFEWQYKQNDLVQGYDYNATTGVRTWKPCSVNGNWHTSFSHIITLPLDKRRRLTLTANTRPEYHHNVSIVDNQRQCAHRMFLQQRLTLSYKLGIHRLSLTGSTILQHISPRSVSIRSADASTINTQDYTCGLSALVTLPWKMELSTDFTTFMRRGYAFEEMNGTDLVWNARLTCPLGKGRLLLMLDGYDLIGQLSNVTRIINAQYRSEQQTNTLPRYAMLHAVWRLSKHPKKK